MVWNYSEATLLLSWRQSMYLRNMACAVTMVWGLARPRANSSVDGDEQMAPHLPKNFVGMHPLGGEGRGAHDLPRDSQFRRHSFTSTHPLVCDLS